MSLKLFRSTGYSSLLSPGHSRETMHPGWIVAAVSLWAGFACNVPLWRALLNAATNPGLPQTLLAGAAVAAASGFALSLFGWRVLLKPAASFVLLLAALAAAARWDQAALDGGLAGGHFAMLPSWASLLRWQVPVLLALLAIAPMAWVWNAPVRRLAGPAQLRSNLTGMAIAAALLGGCALLLTRGLG